MALRSRSTAWLCASVLLCACAARQSAPPVAISARQRAANDERAERRHARWAEYYAEVMERMRKHGGLVIWIAPPQVAARKARP